MGGFPCQAFSIAGNRRGFEDTRGTLFFDLARILRAKSPRLFVFENVKGLLSHNNGETFRTIIAALDELGYDCQWQVLNSKNHGVPQTRERIVIAGHLRGTARPEVFPFGEGRRRNPQAQGGTQGQGERVRSDDLPDWCERETRLVAKTLAVRDYKGGNNLLQYEDGSIRRLTPRESERLQGFPDDWTKFGKDGELISDTQRYKMCGNAVTTNVFRDVFTQLVDTEA